MNPKGFKHCWEIPSLHIQEIQLMPELEFCPRKPWQSLLKYVLAETAVFLWSHCSKMLGFEGHEFHMWVESMVVTASVFFQVSEM